MIFIYLFKQDYYSKYKLHGEAKLFDDVQSLIFHMVGIVNKWSLENIKEKQLLSPEIIYAILLKFRITLPFVFSNKSDVLLEKISYEFKLTDFEKEKLRSLIFNFGLKCFFENEFGHKFIRFAFELMEN